MNDLFFTLTPFLCFRWIWKNIGSNQSCYWSWSDE